MVASPFFNAHHSPIGAFATFTLGYKGAKGGMGLELAGPADEPVYIGAEDAGGGAYSAFPFFDEAVDAAADYDVEGHTEITQKASLKRFEDDEISREMGASIDEWRAGDLTFRIISPVEAVPDPELEDARNALIPAVYAELTLDNRNGDLPRKMFFGYGGSDRYAGMRILREQGLTGVGQGTSVAIASRDEGLTAGLAWQPEAILNPPNPQHLGFMLGSIGMIVGVAAPGEIRTIRFAIGFFRDGIATTGIPTRYLYQRWFSKVEQVLGAALDRFEKVVVKAKAFDVKLRENLSPERAWMLAHAIRSYFGSTQLLERGDGRPLWVVNEGEYRMMNTLDLTVDQAFFELALNPWTVRNELELFLENYSYHDGAVCPGCKEVHSGGIAFTHDMGVSNAFSPKGWSAYELAGISACFSFMSSEELMNWVLTAGLYVTQEEEWAKSHLETFEACLLSLENRDAPEAERRNGIMGLDGARCEGGAEITTYDSLDASLGQARNNLYLGVKGWATYLVLENLFQKLGRFESALRARLQAQRAAESILSARDENGFLPAVIGEGIQARIIPAIEALIYPFVLGIDIDDFNEFVAALDTHFKAVLQPGICRFEDGGWRLSSTSQNSWLSKIYLCQFVAERVLGHAPDEMADGAHLAWLKDEDNAYFAWSDQMLTGKAVGSRYYPRGVTGALWLTKGADILGELRQILTV